MDPVPGTPAFIPPTRGIKIVGISCNGTEFWGPQGTTAHTFLRSLRGKAVQPAQGRSSPPPVDFPPKLWGRYQDPHHLATRGPSYHHHLTLVVYTTMHQAGSLLQGYPCNSGCGRGRRGRWVVGERRVKGGGTIKKVINHFHYQM